MTLLLPKSSVRNKLNVDSQQKLSMQERLRLWLKIAITNQVSATKVLLLTYFKSMSLATRSNALDPST